jgi:hypothetical protein
MPKINYHTTKPIKIELINCFIKNIYLTTNQGINLRLNANALNYYEDRNDSNICLGIIKYWYNYGASRYYYSNGSKYGVLLNGMPDYLEFECWGEYWYEIMSSPILDINLLLKVTYEEEQRDKYIQSIPLPSRV